MKYLIYTKTIWNPSNKNVISQKKHIKNKLNLNEIKRIKPERIFFIHWSTLIPEKIFSNYNCIQFHCSNLPKFRGGSPIQNQITRGITKTKLCAFKVEKKLDSGNLCLKKNLNLDGSAEKILKKIEDIAFKEIKNSLTKKNLIFVKQKGKSSFFRRRYPSESKITNNLDKISKIYDHIRMLDAKNYPKAFFELKNFKFEFFDVFKKGNNVYGNFKVAKK
tara:strand:+ start:437 stop:1093 length:657 start_codon:yes stop_codon:yes gene_type:complete